jgi:branched-chain amino acid aminotransferase
MTARASGRTQRIWRDGKMVDWDDCTIHVMAHVVHYGSSVFEGIRCYETPNGGAVFRLKDHMRRLLDSCRIYRIELPYSVDDLVQATVDAVVSNELRECYIRPVVVRTGEQMGFDPTGVPVETFIIPWHWGPLHGHGSLDNGIDVCVSTWRRAAPDTFPTMAKAGGNYLNSQLTKLEAANDSYAQGIMLDVFGFISEGSGENVFIVRDDVLYTSPVSAGILHGITRDTIMKLAAKLGYQVREQQMLREMLYLADEVFMCGTAAEVTPVRSVDRLPVGDGKPGPITRALQQEYLAIAHGRRPDSFGWLTPLPVAALSAR